MLFLRRTPAIQALHVRSIKATDHDALFQLINQTPWTSLSMPQDELVLTLDPALSFVAEHDQKIWATLLTTWAKPPNVWLRAVAVRQPMRPTDVLPRLFQAATQVARIQQVKHIHIMSDHYDLIWLRPVLLQYGFQPQVEVITYEKHAMHIPAWGNQAVMVRSITPHDITAIAQVDAAAFHSEWVKQESILTHVQPHAPCYLVAEYANQVVGYAFATLHHGGLIAHLVRIAVLPLYHQQQIGVRLLAEVTHWCRCQGIQMLSLNTQATNTQAQRLYEWFGFHQTADRQLVLRYAV